MNLDFVRQLPLFSKVKPQDLEWLLGTAEAVAVPAGHVLMREGEPGGSLYIVLEGEVEISKLSGRQEVLLAVRGAGEVIGEMSLLDRAPRSATVRASRDSRLLLIRQDAFQQLLSSSPSATLAILQTVTTRLRNTESMMKQNEKMAALGTLSAGLAHELNNPAAAARRSAAQLRETLAHWQNLTAALGGLKLTSAQAETLHQLESEMMRGPVTTLDPLAQSDREGKIQDWLERRGVESAWEVAPALAGLEWDRGKLDDLAARFAPEQMALVVQWLAAGQGAFALLDEVAQSAERISEIVQAVKSYSYLDQAPVQQVDVHQALDNTLVILRFKLKQGVQVRREYAPDLPKIEAYGSELNQVWTNIIDNAVDAMQGQGELTLRTQALGNDEVLVEIGDNGPGIPSEIQSRIYEPFFTTKPPGVGTGLGLNITYNIVARHHGRIQVTSQPGATLFQVILPVRLPS